MVERSYAEWIEAGGCETIGAALGLDGDAFHHCTELCERTDNQNIDVYYSSQQWWVAGVDDCIPITFCPFCGVHLEAT